MLLWLCDGASWGYLWPCLVTSRHFWQQSFNSTESDAMQAFHICHHQVICWHTLDSPAYIWLLTGILLLISLQVVSANTPELPIYSNCGLSWSSVCLSININCLVKILIQLLSHTDTCTVTQLWDLTCQHSKCVSHDMHLQRLHHLHINTLPHANLSIFWES